MPNEPFESTYEQVILNTANIELIQNSVNVLESDVTLLKNAVSELNVEVHDHDALIEQLVRDVAELKERVNQYRIVDITGAEYYIGNEGISDLTIQHYDAQDPRTGEVHGIDLASLDLEEM